MFKTIRIRTVLLLLLVGLCSCNVLVQAASVTAGTTIDTTAGCSLVADTTADTTLAAIEGFIEAGEGVVDANDILTPEATLETPGFFKTLKIKFVEGNPAFMSLIALALVIGLVFCIERIIMLSLSRIDAKRFMADIEAKIAAGDVEGAKQQCLNTRGPVASLCYQGLQHIHETMDNIERSVVAYGSMLSAKLEKGCSWITLCITIAPSLGFLGTVIGMVMAFDNIQAEGDISPTIVAEGMKVALITTIFGIIVAVILQVFYNFILMKIEHLTSQMEESAITLFDSIMRYKHGTQSKEDVIPVDEA